MALRKNSTSPQTLERHSVRMAEIAKTHYNKIQEIGLPTESSRYKRRVKKVLKCIDRKLSETHINEMNGPIQVAEVREAIRILKNGKAAGLDGIPHEVWKELASGREEEDSGFDIAKAFTTVFNDICIHGMVKDTNFAEGWLCPLYKKGDRMDIGNYRPITILNTDYKILTKILAMRMSTAAPTIIHPAQAGFMKDRRIEDQTELAHMMIKWCEASNTNGMIICLDQEKAYDKIAHAFLWASLKKFGFPTSFINTIKSLYSEAQTTIILNGEKSHPFKVTRGVRQGDPMSCMLFNIAIESLAQMIRTSKIKGLRLGNHNEYVKETMFADDTTVYLSEDDSFSGLQKTLKKWCKVSGANFNIPKTVAVPVGSKSFQERAISTRQLRQGSDLIPTSIRILGDGEATRLLGTFIGNEICKTSVWTPTIEKIAEDLERWKKARPTMEGKRLIIGMVVAGRTQFRTHVQGMPKQIEERLNKMIREFIWGESSHLTVGMQTLTLPHARGGKKVLDLGARNEAIEIMKAKCYLKLDENRPDWAKVADAIIGRKIAKKWNVKDDKAFSCTFLQNMDVDVRDKEDGLPPSLQRMLRVARKHSISFNILEISETLKMDMPIWFHIGLSDERNMRWNAGQAVCLRKAHKVKSVGDMLKVADDTDERKNSHHKRRKNCACPQCKLHREAGCMNPHKCGDFARSLLGKLKRRWNPKEKMSDRLLTEEERAAAQAEGVRVFEPGISTSKSLGEGFRVFTDKRNN